MENLNHLVDLIEVVTPQKVDKIILSKELVSDDSEKIIYRGIFYDRINRNFRGGIFIFVPTAELPVFEEPIKIWELDEMKTFDISEAEIPSVELVIKNLLDRRFPAEIPGAIDNLNVAKEKGLVYKVATGVLETFLKQRTPFDYETVKKIVSVAVDEEKNYVKFIASEKIDKWVNKELRSVEEVAIKSRLPIEWETGELEALFEENNLFYILQNVLPPQEQAILFFLPWMDKYGRHTEIQFRIARNESQIEIKTDNGGRLSLTCPTEQLFKDPDTVFEKMGLYPITDDVIEEINLLPVELDLDEVQRKLPLLASLRMASLTSSVLLHFNCLKNLTDSPSP